GRAEHPGGRVGGPGAGRRVQETHPVAAPRQLLGAGQPDDPRAEHAHPQTHRAHPTAATSSFAAVTGSRAPQIPAITATPWAPAARAVAARGPATPPIATSGSTPAARPSDPGPRGSGSPALLALAQTGPNPAYVAPASAARTTSSR